METQRSQEKPRAFKREQAEAFRLGARALRTRTDAAIADALRALRTSAEHDNPNGPAFVPTHEIAGKLLARLGKPAEAKAEFEAALDQHPNREPSLLGALRAARASGDTARAQSLAKDLAALSSEADADAPALLELRASK
jgi:Tfp pilus assembly protein PilF